MNDALSSIADRLIDAMPRHLVCIKETGEVKRMICQSGGIMGWCFSVPYEQRVYQEYEVVNTGIIIEPTEHTKE